MLAALCIRARITCAVHSTLLDDFVTVHTNCINGLKTVFPQLELIKIIDIILIRFFTLNCTPS